MTGKCCLIINDGKFRQWQERVKLFIVMFTVNEFNLIVKFLLNHSEANSIRISTNLCVNNSCSKHGIL